MSVICAHPETTAELYGYVICERCLAAVPVWRRRLIQEIDAGRVEWTTDLVWRLMF